MTKKMFLILCIVSLIVVSAATAGCTTTQNENGNTAWEVTISQ